MILADGGDLTNIVLDDYPELIQEFEGFLKKQLLVFTDYMKDIIMTNCHYLQLT